MMKCNICEKEMKEREATVKAPYRYALSGLRNVSLAGITVYECPKCGIEEPIIPKVAQLNDLIRQILIQKPSALKGDEIRFLRKNAGISAKRFASLLRVSPEHLSRVEKGKTLHLGAQADKLIRAIAATADKKALREILLEEADRRLNANAKQRCLFQLEGEHWEARAA